MLDIEEQALAGRRAQKAVRLWARAHPGETLASIEQLFDWLLKRSGATHAAKLNELMDEMRNLIFSLGDVEADGVVEVQANAVIALRSITSRFSGLFELREDDDND